jgi:hypothetical protein
LITNLEAESRKETPIRPAFLSQMPRKLHL